MTASAARLPFEKVAPKTERIKISFKLLLSLYIIFPLSMLAFLVDKYGFNSALKPFLPLAPEHFFWLSLLFGTPHIIASNVILVTNKEYFTRYWKRLSLVTLGIIVFFAVGNSLLSYNTLFAIVATTTIIHVVKQQIGIGNAVAKLSGPLFQTWAWSVIGSGVVLYNAIFLKHIFSADQKILLSQALMMLCVIIFALASICHRHIQKPLGKAFLWANSFMAFLGLFFYTQEYYFFAVLGPRVVHDLTAFVFYIAHDYNRHHVSAKNNLYKIFNKLNLSAIVAVPAIAIFTTFVLQQYGNQAFDAVTTYLFNVRVPGAITLGFIGYLSLMHYYTEAFTWKGSSPYKKYVFFK